MTESAYLRETVATDHPSGAAASRDAMADERAPESIFLEHLPLIERIASLMGRRNGLTGEDAADFRSWVISRLIEDDYAPIRKFRGASSVGTYLTVVIAMLSRDYRVQERGRWRPSAAARREGDLAVRLESLVYRSHYSLVEAGQLLRTSGATNLSDRQLGQILTRLPVRSPMRPITVTTEALAEVSTGAKNANELIVAAEGDEDRRRIKAIMDNCIGAFPAQDRLLLRMRFWEDLSVADIARALGVEQKPLYRRIGHLLAELRGRLRGAGVTPEQVASLVDGDEP